MYIDALTYPLRRNGWLMILLGTIFAVVLEFLAFAPITTIVVVIFTVGYFGAYYLSIVGTTMNGRDEVPRWPSIRSFWHDIAAPFFRLMGLVAFSFAPVVTLALFADENAMWFPVAVLGAVIFGCLYFPMAVLAMQAMGGLGATLPHVVLPALFKVMPRDLLALGALVPVFFICWFAQGITARVPYVGWLLTAALPVYGMMFQGRLIGLIYVEKQDRLGWE